jgi:hypothetical protein
MPIQTDCLRFGKHFVFAKIILSKKNNDRKIVWYRTFEFLKWQNKSNEMCWIFKTKEIVLIAEEKRSLPFYISLMP